MTIILTSKNIVLTRNWLTGFSIIPNQTITWTAKNFITWDLVVFRAYNIQVCADLRNTFWTSENIYHIITRSAIIIHPLTIYTSLLAVWALPCLCNMVKKLWTHKGQLCQIILIINNILSVLRIIDKLASICSSPHFTIGYNWLDTAPVIVIHFYNCWESFIF